MNIIERAMEALLPITSQIDPENARWISGGDCDQSLLYCYTCAVKEVAKLKKQDPEAEFIVDGGWGTEEDGNCFCDACGVYLASNYTDNAVAEELQHWEENPPRHPILPVDAHSLSEMFQAGQHSPEMKEDLERVAKAVINAVPAAPTIEE
jgi:hypothetical protein